MGMLNWLTNRGLDSWAYQAKYRQVIELTATSSTGLNKEINKYAAKGYMLQGAPIQGRDWVWRATMICNPEAKRELEDQKTKSEQEKINLELKKMELAQKKQAIEDAKTPEQKAKEKEKSIAKAKLAGSLVLGPLGLVSKKNRENIKDSVNKLLDK